MPEHIRAHINNSVDVCLVMVEARCYHIACELFVLFKLFLKVLSLVKSHHNFYLNIFNFKPFQWCRWCVVFCVSLQTARFFHPFHSMTLMLASMFICFVPFWWPLRFHFAYSLYYSFHCHSAECNCSVLPVYQRCCTVCWIFFNVLSCLLPSCRSFLLAAP